MLRRQTFSFRPGVFAAFSLVFAAATHAHAIETAATTVTMVPQLVHAMDSHHAAVMSPNGRLAASVHRGAVHLWDVESGALLRVHPMNGAQSTLAFSSNGHVLRFVSSTNAGFLIHTWNVATNETTHIKAADTVIALLAEGRRALVRDWKSGGLQLLDVDNNKPIRVFAAHAAPRPPLGTHDPHQVATVAVSGRGDLVLLERWDGACELWDAERGTLRFKEEHKKRAPYLGIAAEGSRAAFVRPAKQAHVDELVVLDAQNGKILRSMPIPLGSQALAVSPDGRRAWVVNGGSVRLWDLDAGTAIRRESTQTQNVRTFAFVDDNRLLYGPSGQFEIRQAEDFKLIRSFTGDKPTLATPESVAFMRGADEMLVIDDEGSNANFRHWDLTRLELQGSTGFNVSGDMARLTADASRAWLKNSILSVVTLQMPNFERRDLKMDWSTFQLRPTPVLPWPNSSRAVVDAKRLRVDPATQKPTAEYVIAALDATTGTKVDAIFEPWQDNMEQFLTAISSDGRYVAASVFDTKARLGDVKVWDFQKVKLERTWKLNSLTMPIATFLPSERIAIAYLPKDSGSRLTVSVFDMRSGASLWSAQVADSVSQVIQSSPDGTLLGVAGTKVTVFDSKSGDLVGAFSGDAAVVETFAFSQDNRYLICGGRTGVTTLHRLDKRTNVHLIASGEDWLAYTDDGYFDASRKGGRLVAAVQDQLAYRIDQLAVRNNRPDILLERLGLGTPEMVRHYHARYRRRLEKLGIRAEAALPTYTTTPEIALNAVDVEGAMANVRFDAAARGADLLRYNIFVNDVPLFGPLGKSATGRAQHVEERIELGSGRNKIEVSALDATGGESLRAVRVIEYNTPAKGDLYYLAFGVSQYKNPKYNLGYPHKDVLDLGDVLRAGAGKAFRQVHVRTHVDKEATVDNIRRAKEFLKDAGVEDTVILFIAGHGLHSRDAAADYYFATHEVDPKRLADTAARFDVVEDLLMGIRSRKKLFLMDTCESGEREEDDAPSAGIPGASRTLLPRSTRALVLDVAEAQRTAGETPPKLMTFHRERYIYNDLLRRSGAIVISSSRGSEFSFELPEIENGVFTEEILRALTSEQADRNADGTVSTDELRAHLRNAVPARTENQQHPTADRDNLEVNFGFPVVKEVAAIVDRPASALPQSREETVATPVVRPPMIAPHPRGCGCDIVGDNPSNTRMFAAIMLAFAAFARRIRR